MNSSKLTDREAEILNVWDSISGTTGYAIETVKAKCNATVDELIAAMKRREAIESTRRKHWVK